MIEAPTQFDVAFRKAVGIARTRSPEEIEAAIARNREEQKQCVANALEYLREPTVKHPELNMPNELLKVSGSIMAAKVVQTSRQKYGYAAEDIAKLTKELEASKAARK
jgi:hypothetical protein